MLFIMAIVKRLGDHDSAFTIFTFDTDVVAEVQVGYCHAQEVAWVAGRLLA